MLEITTLTLLFMLEIKKNVKYCLSLRSKISLNIISEFSGTNSHSDLDRYAEDTGKAVAIAKIRLCFPEFSATAILRGPSRGPSRKKHAPLFDFHVVYQLTFFLFTLIYIAARRTLY